MASARAKTTRTTVAVQYDPVPLIEALLALGVPQADIVAGERWSANIRGETVVLTRHRGTSVAPGAS